MKTSVIVAVAIVLAGCSEEEPGVCDCLDASVEPDAGPAMRAFANTLIRGRPPGSAFAGDTVAAIEEAAAAGYEYVEIDVRVTADGHLLPCRDDSLAGFSTCRGKVSESTVADLAGCMTTDREPTALRPLDDVLPAASFSGIFLDLKSTESDPISTAGQIRDAVVALRELVADPTTIVAMSYRQDAATALLAVGVRTGLKGYPDDPAQTHELLDDASATGAEMICVNAWTIDDGVADDAAESDVWLFPWAYANQVDAALVCDLRKWHAGGLISEAFETVDSLMAESCR